MKRILWFAAAGYLAGLALAGCQTMVAREPMMITEVMPSAGEHVTLNRLVILVDASGSIDAFREFPMVKALVSSFVQAMPSGSYDVALNSFGSADHSAWMKNRLAPFSREELAADAMELQFIGKSTPMSDALVSLIGALSKKQGRGGLLLISDGNPQDKIEDLIEDVKLLASAHGKPFCVYTVCVGEEEEEEEEEEDMDDGVGLMKALASATGCGAYWNATEVMTPAGMDAMVRKIFFDVVRLDSDGDGVYDDEDECPGTPRGARVDSRGCWVIQGLNFDHDKSVIKPEFEAGLAEVAEVLRKNPGIRIRIEGHTDSDGSTTYNVGLSQRRAEAVRADLVARGIPAGMLQAQGMGETHPAVPNTSAQNKYINRRVELTVLP